MGEGVGATWGTGFFLVRTSGMNGRLMMTKGVGAYE